MPKNCLNDYDGEYNYKFVCATGHVGPLCECCDLKGKIWKTNYG